MEVFERYTLRDNESKISKHCHRKVTIPAKTRAAASTMRVQILVQKTLERIGLEVIDTSGRVSLFFTI
jgi:hypothetical protein